MFWDQLNDWLLRAPLTYLALGALMLMVAAVAVGVAARKVSDRDPSLERIAGEGLEGVIVSAVLGLLALLIGFTFSIVLNRFEARRDLVLQEANAIGTVYLRAQLLEEPHRARVSRLLVTYTDNRIALATASPGGAGVLLARNDRLITDLWAATAAAVVTIKDPGVSSAFVVGMNSLIDLDTARKVARSVHLPAEVFVVLLGFLVVAAAMLGYLSVGRRGKVALSLMILLVALSLLLILDVDRPTGGGIREDQTPMEQLKASLKAQPPVVFDRFRTEGPAATR